MCFLFFITDDVGKELENSINERGVPGQSLYIRCDVTDENEIEVIKWVK